MRHLLLSAVLLCAPFFTYAEDAAIAGLFRKAGVDGTLLIESVNTGRRFVHNDARATRPFTAASTFKVLNTLIALEEGVIAGEDSTIPWDGTRHEIAAWNHDKRWKAHSRSVACGAIRSWQSALARTNIPLIAAGRDTAC